MTNITKGSKYYKNKDKKKKADIELTKAQIRSLGIASGSKDLISKKLARDLGIKNISQLKPKQLKRAYEKAVKNQGGHRWITDKDILFALKTPGGGKAQNKRGGGKVKKYAHGGKVRSYNFIN